MKKTFTLLAAILITGSIFAQAQRLVLFEEFTGENCPPCAAYNPYVDALANAYPSEVVLMHYLAPIPTAGILSGQVYAVVNGRLNFYGVNSTPWGQQDGAMWDSSLLTNYGNNPISWCVNLNTGYQNADYLNSESQVPSPFTITISDVLTGVSDSFYATVTITAEQTINLPSELKLQMAMVENLQFNTPPGNNGETSWGNAVRAMYPSYAGTGLSSSWTNGQVATYTFKGKMPSFIRDKTQVRFVAFIQDNIDKHVQQTAISSFYSFDVDVATAGLQGSFDNCPSSQYAPIINITNVGNNTISSCNISEYLDNVFIDSSTWSGSIANGGLASVSLARLTIPTGIHKITVQLTSPNNTGDPNPGNDSVSIVVSIPDSETNMPLVEGFENGDPATNAGWAVENPDHDSTWRVVSTGDNSASSYMVDFIDEYEHDFVGPTNNLYTPPLNLAYAAHATIKFSFANQWIYFGLNQQGDSTFGLDSLYIDVSSDCGNTWTTVYGTGATTAGAQSDNSLYIFEPTADQWISDTADISVAANHENVLLRFRPLFYDGNQFFLDNVNIYKYDSVPYNPAGIEPVSNIQSLTVYPNPASNMLNFNLTINGPSHLTYVITDVSGRVLQSENTTGVAGENIYSVNTSTLASGTYFLTLNTEGQQTSRIFSVTH